MHTLVEEKVEGKGWEMRKKKVRRSEEGGIGLIIYKRSLVIKLWMWHAP